MKKIAIVGMGVAGVLALVGIGALKYSQNRVTAEVETAFAAIKATGTDATYGEVSFDLWSQTLRIKDIALKSNSTAATLNIADLSAHGVASFGGGVSANYVALTAVTASVSLVPSDKNLRTTYAIPLVELHNALQSANTETDQKKTWISEIARFSASSITAQTVNVSTTVPVPPAKPPASALATKVPKLVMLEYICSNFRVDKIGDGKMSRVSLDKITISGSDDLGFVSGTIVGVSSTDIDLMPYFGGNLANRQAENGYYPVHGIQAIGPIAINMPNGGKLTIASITSGGFGVDPTKASYAKIVDMLPLINAMDVRPGTQPTPQQMLALGSVLGDLYEGMKFPNINMKSIRVSSPQMPTGREFSIDRISMTGLERGRLGEFRIDQVNSFVMSQPGQVTPIKFGSFSLRGLGIAQMMRTATQMVASGRPPSAEDWARFPSMIDSVELTDVTVPDPKTGQIIHTDRMAMSWGQFINGVPATNRLTIKGVVPVDPADPKMATLLSRGINAFDFAMDFGSSYAEADKTWRLAPIEASMTQVGAISGQITFVNMHRNAFSFAPNVFATAVRTAEIASIDVKIKDAGFIAMAQALTGTPAVTMIAEMRPKFIDTARPSPGLESLFDAVGKFAATPGQTLTLKLKSKTPMNFASILGDLAIPSIGIPGIFDGLTIDADVSR
jgi:hypothetical protein